MALNRSRTPTSFGTSSKLGLEPRLSIRFSQLSVSRQLLVRMCQQTNFGEIREVEVRGREPLFGTGSVVLVDHRLDADDVPRREVTLPDFTLCDEFCRLLAKLDHIENGRINRIEIRAGLPRRILFEAQVEGVLR